EAAKRQAMPARFGFHDAYPVRRAKHGAQVIATYGDPRARKTDGSERPYLVAMAKGNGRVVYLGSGEMWRLRQYRHSYHDRFWTELANYTASRDRNNKPSSVLIVGDEYRLGDSVVIEVRLIKPNFDPHAISVSPRVRIIAPRGIQ